LAFSRKRVLQHVSEFNIEYNIELHPHKQGEYKVTVDVPDGAGGINLLWFMHAPREGEAPDSSAPEAQFLFGGRTCVQKKRNVSILALPEFTACATDLSGCVHVQNSN
jgi:hypothetical protein